ncbi:cupin domain-containing protein [Poseidonocella sp. HB161398]|uniref:cupin domain-containing protein n=1 Tax=Poseidonocella sp. HB161398 TaxID=2320855 RepID=UPI001109FCB2|nr:cupin domain-containing protein [Poseidonocella sp. HB161398]
MWRPPTRPLGLRPGAEGLYALRDGQGEYHLIGGMVATLIARQAETGGAFEAAVLTGSVGTGLLLHRHGATDAALYVLVGRLEQQMDGQAHLLTAGDHALVPAGTAQGLRRQNWRMRLPGWSIGTGLAGGYPALGAPFSRPVQPELEIPQARLDAAAATDTEFPGLLPAVAPVLVTVAGLPAATRPYVPQDGG